MNKKLIILISIIGFNAYTMDEPTINLIFALSMNNNKKADALIKEHNIDLKAVKAQFESLAEIGKLNDKLINAIESNDIERVKTLLTTDANSGLSPRDVINYQSYSRRAALHETIENGYIEIARLLIDKGADLNIQDGFGHTPLHLAAIERKDDIAELLISKGAKFMIQNRYGDTPLHVVTCDGYGDIRGRKATFKNRQAIAKLLLEAGSDVNAINNSGETPLHNAAVSGDKDMVKLLLKAGATRTIRNKENRTAAQEAKRLATKELINSYMPVTKR